MSAASLALVAFLSVGAVGCEERPAVVPDTQPANGSGVVVETIAGLMGQAVVSGAAASGGDGELLLDPGMLGGGEEVDTQPAPSVADSTSGAASTGATAGFADEGMGAVSDPNAAAIMAGESVVEE